MQVTTYRRDADLCPVRGWTNGGPADGPGWASHINAFWAAEVAGKAKMARYAYWLILTPGGFPEKDRAKIKGVIRQKRRLLSLRWQRLKSLPGRTLLNSPGGCFATHLAHCSVGLFYFRK
ncbi:hypothetical protein DLNHIDIE_03457 [Acidithiobacillus thiooxidans ATCC 19377]|uniref:Uncharacterized protein n=1 Tax=Acidithiobacillus thiooxidans ATCC 19377 TaxID=637390 RepID=A0A543PYP7_ACITH|nr:hypothetical protein DLNHIDIE_03457 [Acidithiobacillus thiooxidans ATCC 19377]